MRIYNYNPETGAYVGASYADESPLEPGVFLIPAHSTEIEPPVTMEGKVAVFNGESWSIEDIVIPEPPVEPTAEELAAKASARAALLERLGITEEEAKLLLS